MLERHLPENYEIFVNLDKNHLAKVFLGARWVDTRTSLATTGRDCAPAHERILSPQRGRHQLVDALLTRKTAQSTLTTMTGGDRPGYKIFDCTFAKIEAKNHNRFGLPPVIHDYRGALSAPKNKEQTKHKQ